MARLKTPKNSVRKSERTARTTRRRLNASAQDVSRHEREDLEESEDRYQDKDEADFREDEIPEEEEGENADKHPGQIESEEEEHVSSPSLTRRRHHAREEVVRVGRIKQRPTEFSSNGRRRNRSVLFRGVTGGRTSLRRAWEPTRETRRERTLSSRLNRRRTAATETQALAERRRNKSATSGIQQKYSGNGQSGLRSAASTRRTREGRTLSPLRASRRRER